MGGREHTVVRVLRPRKKYVLLPFQSLFSYNTINSRRKEFSDHWLRTQAHADND